MEHEKKLKLLAGFIIGLVVFVGAWLAMYLFHKESGGYEFSIGLIVAASSICGFLISYFWGKWKKKQNGNVPEIDERTVTVMKSYFIYAFVFVMVISAILSLILFIMNVETVEVGMLFVYQMILYILIGLGAFIAKRI